MSITVTRLTAIQNAVCVTIAIYGQSHTISMATALGVELFVTMYVLRGGGYYEKLNVKGFGWQSTHGGSIIGSN